MPAGVRPFSKADKRAAIELWKAKVPHKYILAQIQLSDRGRRKIIVFAKHHPEALIPKKSKNVGLLTKIFRGAIREIRKAIERGGNTTYY
jgi:hypothetical protein